MPGTIYLVGAGPGDPELLTVKALRILQLADIIFYDRLIPPAILALAHPSARLVYAGKSLGEQHDVQTWLDEELIRAVQQHRHVVRLKSGDPFIFGRGAEEKLSLLSAGIAVEVVPGLSSATSVPTLAGIPLTYRGLSRSFTVVTAMENQGPRLSWDAFRRSDTLVILMGGSRAHSVAAELIRDGRPANEPVALIANGSRDDEERLLTSLASLAAGSALLSQPSVMVVGQVALLMETSTSHAVCMQSHLFY
jgi:uroporphyrin-III C-methyltransferase